MKDYKTEVQGAFSIMRRVLQTSRDVEMFDSVFVIFGTVRGFFASALFGIWQKICCRIEYYPSITEFTGLPLVREKSGKFKV